MDVRFGLLKRETFKRIKAFEMWAYKRILCALWIDRIKNEDVLHSVGKPNEMIVDD